MRRNKLISFVLSSVPVLQKLQEHFCLSQTPPWAAWRGLNKLAELFLLSHNSPWAAWCGLQTFPELFCLSGAAKITETVLVVGGSTKYNSQLTTCSKPKCPSQNTPERPQQLFAIFRIDFLEKICYKDQICMKLHRLQRCCRFGWSSLSSHIIAVFVASSRCGGTHNVMHSLHCRHHAASCTMS